MFQRFQSDYLTQAEVDHMFRQALRHHELQRLATHIGVLAGAPDDGQYARAEEALARLVAGHEGAMGVLAPTAPIIEGELVAPVDAPVIEGELVAPVE